jgi:phage protein D
MGDKAFQVFFGGQAVDDSFYGDLNTLTVEENTSTASTFHMQILTRLQDDGSWLYLTEDWLTPFTQTSIKIGFTGGGGLAAALGSLIGSSGGDDGLKSVFDGYVTDVQLRLSTQQGSNFIDVSGMDTSVLMGLEEKIAVWPNMSDSDIAQAIVSAYSGVTVVADPTTTVHQDTDTTVVQRGTDLQFVRDLAQRNGLEFYFQTDDTGTISAYFQAPQVNGTPQPDLAMHFEDASNMRSFSAHLTSQRPLNVKSMQMDVTANSANVASVGTSSLAKLGDKDATALVGSALGPLVTPSDAPAQMLVLGTPTSDQTEMQTVAQAVRDEAGWFIHAEGEINSDAYQNVLRPHGLVLVKGAGTPFSGKYYVTRVVHTITSSGSYKQNFEARRNARDLDGTEQFGGDGSGLPIPGI